MTLTDGQRAALTAAPNEGDVLHVSNRNRGSYVHAGTAERLVLDGYARWKFDSRLAASVVVTAAGAAAIEAT